MAPANPALLKALRDILRVKGHEVSQASLVDIRARAEDLREEQLGEGRGRSGTSRPSL